jgi:hypothetical protein
MRVFYFGLMMAGIFVGASSCAGGGGSGDASLSKLANLVPSWTGLRCEMGKSYCMGDRKFWFEDTK